MINLFKSGSSGLRLVTPWRWRQQRPSKQWYPTTSLHGVSNKKETRTNFHRCWELISHV